MQKFTQIMGPFVESELSAARQAWAGGQWEESFRHLERAHVLGQHSTALHVRAHVEMLKWAVRRKAGKEIRGQLLRIVGAATKTIFGWVRAGNTGGADVSPIKPMPIPADLYALIERVRNRDRAAR